MKTCIHLLIPILLLTLSGCATSNYSMGRDFPSENVNKIEKGVTTTEQLILLFGEPHSKAVSSGTEENWFYLYTSATATAQSNIISMKVESIGFSKQLNVFIRDGVVTNYVFSEADGPHMLSY